MKRYSFKIVRENINFDEQDTTQVECRGNGFFYIMMAVLFGFFSIFFILLSLDMLLSLNGILAFIFISSMLIIPFFYLILKIKNYCFSIDNDKILHKNIFGKIYEYKLSDIKDIKCVRRSTVSIPEILIIKMEDKRTIVLLEYLTNFELLKFKLKNEGLIDV